MIMHLKLPVTWLVLPIYPNTIVTQGSGPLGGIVGGGRGCYNPSRSGDHVSLQMTLINTV